MLTFGSRRTSFLPDLGEKPGCVLAADIVLNHLVKTLMLLLYAEIPGRTAQLRLAGGVQGQPFIPSALNHPLWLGQEQTAPNPEPSWLKSTGKAVSVGGRAKQRWALGSRHTRLSFPSLLFPITSQPPTPKIFISPSYLAHQRAPCPRRALCWTGRWGKRGTSTDLPITAPLITADAGQGQRYLLVQGFILLSSCVSSSVSPLQLHRREEPVPHAWPPQLFPSVTLGQAEEPGSPHCWE